MKINITWKLERKREGKQTTLDRILHNMSKNLTLYDLCEFKVAPFFVASTSVFNNTQWGVSKSKTKHS